MGHDKLRKFAENETFRCLLQPSSKELLQNGFFNISDHPIKGNWSREMFGGNCNPIVLELGCGKGEYTIALAERNPGINYIGVDIKGARLWKGAKYATEHQLPNVAFLRTRIEFINAFFAPGEVSQIWLTFSDPQMHSENCRLTSPLFLERYRRFLEPGGVIHLKTDSRFLHEYTVAVCRDNGLAVQASTTDLYAEPAVETLESSADTAIPGSLWPSRAVRSSRPGPPSGAGPPPLEPRAASLPERNCPSPAPAGIVISVEPTKAASAAAPSEGSDATDRGAGEAEHSRMPLTGADRRPGVKKLRGANAFAFAPELFEVQTFYEKMFLEQGCKITYMRFTIDKEGSYRHPEFDEKYWRQQEGPRRSFGHDPKKIQ